MDNLRYPYQFEELAEEEKECLEALKKYTDNVYPDMVLVVPTKYVFPRTVMKYGPQIYNFKPRKDDVWLIGFPRSGTTVTQEIIYLLKTNFDYDKAASQILDIRFPFLERVYYEGYEDMALAEELYKKANLSVEEELQLPPHMRLARTKDNRFIKCHTGFAMLHPQLLEVGCKVVFIARNVKDALVSLFYFPFWTVPEDEIQDALRLLFLVYKNDLKDTGNYFDILKEAWERRHNKNLFILFYEDMNKDKRPVIRKLADFLEVKMSEEQLEKLIEHVDIKNFRKNTSVNNDHLVETGLFAKSNKFTFIRNGKSGGWKDIFAPELNEECNEWIQKNLEEIHGFEIPDCWRESMGLDS